MMRAHTSSPTEYFPALTGIRAIAAWLVFAHHFNPQPESTALGYLLLRHTHIGVSLFFVLSGFLITIRYDNTTMAKGWFREYFVNRFARIYPLFFLLTIATFVLHYVADNGAFPWQNFLLNITFLRGFFDELKFTGIAQGWTLTVEECFYMLAPLIFIAKKPLSLIGLCGIFYVLGSVLVLQPLTHWNGFFNSFEFTAIYTFFGRCFEFIAGVLLARNYRSNPGITKGYLRTVAGLAVVGVVFSAMVVSPIILNVNWADFGSIALNNLVLPLGIVLLFSGLIRERTYLQRFLSLPAMQLFGRSSYAFYLIHIGVLQLAISSVVQGNIVMLFIALNMSAILLYKFCEAPLQKWIKKRAGVGPTRTDTLIR